MRTHEEAADLIVGQATCLEVLGKLRVELFVAQVREVTSLIRDGVRGRDFCWRGISCG